MSFLADQPRPAVTTAPPTLDAAAGIVEVLLQGGPAEMPDELRTYRVPCHQDKVKVLHYGGYEHFERAGEHDGRAVFRWTGRTRIAE